MRAPVATAVTIATGLVILVGYFIPLPFLQNLRTILLGWGVTLLGVGALVGITNLVAVHWRRARTRQNRDLYSILLIVAFLATLAAGLVLTPSDARFQRMVTSIQVPIETSLLALLAVTLTFAGLRLLQRRKGIMPVIFILALIIFLVLASGIISYLPPNTVVNGLVGFFNRLPLAGARGILLGVALGGLVTALRIFLGADRPYSG